MTRPFGSVQSVFSMIITSRWVGAISMTERFECANSSGCRLRVDVLPWAVSPSHTMLNDDRSDPL
jgi:hypothetical protein